MKKILLGLLVFPFTCVIADDLDNLTSDNKQAPSIISELSSLEALFSLEVTTLSRTKEKSDLAPGVVYSFSSKTIQERGYRSLKDLLLVIPGFSVFIKGNGAYVAGIRGLNSVDNEKITLLINGCESNNLQEPEFMNGPINLQNVERVEVVVGPSSFFQRSNTLAATINIITNKVVGTEVFLSTGTDTPYAVTAVSGKSFSRGNYVNGSFTLENKDGFNAWDKLNRSGLEDTTYTGELFPSIFATLEGEYNNLWAQAILYQANFPELNLNSKGNKATYKDHMLLFNLKHTKNINAKIDLVSLFNVGKKATHRFNDSGPTINNALEVEYSQTDYSGEFGLDVFASKQHNIKTGFQWSYEDNDEFFATVNNVYVTLVDTKEDTHALGFYLYDEWQRSDDVIIEGGIRFDRNTILENDKNHWGGRFAFICSNNEQWTTKLIANRAVRFPSPIGALNQAWGADKANAPNFANKTLNVKHPEILRTYELQNIIYASKSRYSLNLYYQDLSNFITWNGPHTNAGDFSGYGIEGDVFWSISKKINFWVNASFVNTEFESFVSSGVINAGSGGGVLSVNDEKKILGSPSLTVNYGLELQYNEQTMFNCQMRYFTDQASYSREKSAFEEVDNVFYVDATATYHEFLKESVDLSLSAYNLFNNRDLVSTQWRRSQYRPRGSSFLLSIKSVF